LLKDRLRLETERTAALRSEKTALEEIVDEARHDVWATEEEMAVRLGRMKREIVRLRDKLSQAAAGGGGGGGASGRHGGGQKMKMKGGGRSLRVVKKKKKEESSAKVVSAYGGAAPNSSLATGKPRRKVAQRRTRGSTTDDGTCATNVFLCVCRQVSSLVY
jgi:hypothetical protein